MFNSKVWFYHRPYSSGYIVVSPGSELVYKSHESRCIHYDLWIHHGVIQIDVGKPCGKSLWEIRKTQNLRCKIYQCNTEVCWWMWGSSNAPQRIVFGEFNGYYIIRIGSWLMWCFFSIMVLISQDGFCGGIDTVTIVSIKLAKRNMLKKQ